MENSPSARLGIVNMEKTTRRRSTATKAPRRGKLTTVARMWVSAWVLGKTVSRCNSRSCDWRVRSGGPSVRRDIWCQTLCQPVLHLITRRGRRLLMGTATLHSGCGGSQLEKSMSGPDWAVRGEMPDNDLLGENHHKTHRSHGNTRWQQENLVVQQR